MTSLITQRKTGKLGRVKSELHDTSLYRGVWEYDTFLSIFLTKRWETGVEGGQGITLHIRDTVEIQKGDCRATLDDNM